MRHLPFFRLAGSLLLLLTFAPPAHAGDAAAPLDPLTAAGFTTDQLAIPVRQAFAATHDGLSSDALLADDRYCRAFDRACRDALDRSAPTTGPPPGADAFTYACRWTLLRLRKSGRLHVPTTRSAGRDPDAPPPERYAPAVEIAARLTLDRFGGSLDALFCDPPRRRHFDREAARLVHSAGPALARVTPTDLRTAALALRKARRLRPELTARIADWDRVVTTHRAADLQAHPDLIPRVPGVYLFRDATGYLYIGEAKDLRARLVQHLNGDGQPALTAHLGAADLTALTLELHAFAPDSNARLTAHRRAYESELIASRQPQFNVRP